MSHLFEMTIVVIRRVDERNAKETKRQQADMTRLLNDLRLGSDDGPADVNSNRDSL